MFKLTKKSVNSAKNGTKKTKDDESIKEIPSVLLFLSLSITTPPIKLPADKPKRVTPIMDVHVKTEEPTTGAITLAETNSSVIKEKPATKELRI